MLHDIAVCNIQQGTVCTLCMALCAQCGLCVETNRLCKHIRTEHSFDKSTRAGLQFSWKKMGLNAYFFVFFLIKFSSDALLHEVASILVHNWLEVMKSLGL